MIGKSQIVTEVSWNIRAIGACEAEFLVFTPKVVLCNHRRGKNVRKSFQDPELSRR
jgi:hypothetical protein